jgi:platelet-activating factor acetylhydrolase
LLKNSNIGYGDAGGIPRFLSSTLLSAVLQGVRLPAYKYAPLSTDPSLPAQLPILIFCHGLKGNQTTYSTFVGNFASRGFVCLSLEHRDRSAAVTGENKFSKVTRYEDPEKDDVKEAMKFPHETEEEYLLRYRKEQIDFRLNEVKDAIELIKNLSHGDKVENLLGQWLPNFKDRLDLDNMVIAGHSFGAATGLVCLQSLPDVFKCGIILE